MSVAIDRALYSVLTADTGSGGVSESDVGATGGIHQFIAEQTAGFPRIHFQELVTTPTYTFRVVAADHVFYQIKALAVDSVSHGTPGTSIAGNLNERIRALLTDNALSISGATLLYCRFERSIPPYAEWDETNNRFIYHKGGIYEIWLQ